MADRSIHMRYRKPTVVIVDGGMIYTSSSCEHVGNNPQNQATTRLEIFPTLPNFGAVPNRIGKEKWRLMKGRF